MLYNIPLLFFSATLVFIATNLYGWLLKRYYVPLPLKEHFEELYPVHRSVATLYLLQLFEVPYLFHIGQPAALFYVNGTAVMFFASYMMVLVKGYFFMEYPKPKQLFLFMLPVAVCAILLLLPVFGILPFTENFQTVMFCIVAVVSAVYVGLLVRFRNQLHRQIRKFEEDEYSNESDFPLQFAKKVEWMPLLICLVMYVCFILDNPTVKFVRDLILIVMNVWFVFYTLNPHRSLRPELTEALKEETASEEKAAEPEEKHRLTDEMQKELETKLIDLIRNEKLYLEDHLTLNDLAQRIFTNKTYLSEAIARSEYGAFYQLINTMRLEHACKMLDEQPGIKLEQVAFASGFSSGSAFSQVFKRLKGVTPSEYLHNKEG